MFIVRRRPRRPGPTSTGTGSPVSIDWSIAEPPVDDDAVGRDLLAGPHDEPVADARAPRPARHLDAVAQHARLLRAELEQGADRLARAPARPRLEEAPEQDQRRDHRAPPRSTCARRQTRRARRPTRRRRRACRPRRACPSSRAPWRALAKAARWNGQPHQRTTGVGEREREPLPARELQRGNHRDEH